MPLRKNALEWTVFAVSAALVLALVAVLGWNATESDGPPRLVVVVGTAAPREGGGVAVPVTVRNDGPETAAEVEVEVMEDGGDAAMRARIRFDYVPRHSERRGMAVFEAPPRGRVSGRVVAFTEP